MRDEATGLLAALGGEFYRIKIIAPVEFMSRLGESYVLGTQCCARKWCRRSKEGYVHALRRVTDAPSSGWGLAGCFGTCAEAHHGTGTCGCWDASVGAGDNRRKEYLRSRKDTDTVCKLEEKLDEHILWSRELEAHMVLIEQACADLVV